VGSLRRSRACLQHQVHQRLQEKWMEQLRPN